VKFMQAEGWQLGTGNRGGGGWLQWRSPLPDFTLSEVHFRWCRRSSSVRHLLGVLSSTRIGCPTLSCHEMGVYMLKVYFPTSQNLELNHSFPVPNLQPRYPRRSCVGAPFAQLHDLDLHFFVRTVTDIGVETDRSTHFFRAKNLKNGRTVHPHPHKYHTSSLTAVRFRLMPTVAPPDHISENE
jgi:hypothetical protein